MIVWQKGISLAKEIYFLTSKLPNYEVYGLSTQLRRAAISIPSNIAEGQARHAPAEFRRFLRIALGSLAELDTQLILSQDFGYLTKEDVSNVQIMIVELRMKIYALIKSLPKNKRYLTDN